MALVGICVVCWWCLRAVSGYTPLLLSSISDVCLWVCYSTLCLAQCVVYFALSQNFITKTKLLTTDILVLATMKNAAKCDTQCELQNSVNHQTFERILRSGVLTRACLFQWRLPLSPKGSTRTRHLGGRIRALSQPPHLGAVSLQEQRQASDLCRFFVAHGHS